MPSVFAANQVLGGSIRADKVAVMFDGAPATGMLLQNIQFNYTQQVTMLYEIGGVAGSANVYYVGGRAMGTMSVARILGPARAQLNLITEFGDICTPKDMSFNATAGCAGNTGVNYKIHSAVLTTVGVSVAAQDVVIHEQLQFMFINLEANVS